MAGMDRPERTTLTLVATAIAVLALLISAGAVVASNRNATSASGSSGGGSSTSAAATTIDVNLSEFAITPADLTAPPGDITIRVHNTGSMEHNFAVTGVGRTSRNLKPGETLTLELKNVAAGHYDTLCEVPGHSASGMKGTLHVDASFASGSTTASTESTATTISNAQMDQEMATVAGKFLNYNGLADPKIDVTRGGQDLAPKVLSDGTKEFDLEAKVVDWEVEPGKIVKAWTYNGVVPAPVIRVNVGDKVRVVLKNSLAESTSLHFHGIRVPNKMDGVDPYTQDPIKPGETFTYEWTPQEMGVGMYHSHHNAEVQVPNGMAGAFIIGDWHAKADEIVKGMKNPLPGYKGVDQEVNMVLDDSGTIGLALNGKSFPETQGYVMKVGETMLVNYYNEGLLTHPMHLHQPTALVIAKDGIPLESPYYADTVNVEPGSRYTLLVTAKDAGVWAWHCHILNHAETPHGMRYMVTAIVVKP
jgi:FtsP/CotA-like multicopper oxidase with cupredoxin domain